MSHSKPVEGAECAVCFSDIELENYCEYKLHPEDPWTASPICTDCLEFMRESQWTRFTDLVEKADCRAALLRLCRKVPLCVHDANAFACPQHGKECTKNGELSNLWIAESGEETVPILTGAKQGKEREEYIIHLGEIALLLENKEDAGTETETKSV